MTGSKPVSRLRASSLAVTSAPICPVIAAVRLSSTAKVFSWLFIMNIGNSFMANPSIITDATTTTAASMVASPRWLFTMVCIDAHSFLLLVFTRFSPSSQNIFPMDDTISIPITSRYMARKQNRQSMLYFLIFSGRFITSVFNRWSSNILKSWARI
jgi:hypothetical protein